MISKAVGNCIFTTIERPPYDNLTCELFEVSKSWGWIWFSFLELITLEANTKSVTFFLHVSVCSAVRADAEVWYKTYQNRRWSTSCTGSKQLQPAILFLGSLRQSRHSSPVEGLEDTFVYEMGATACPYHRAVSEFFQSSSLTGYFALLSGCGEELSGPSGSFHSPGYPTTYPSNRECIWYIHTAPGSSIQLTIQEFDIEYHPNCSYDVLEVRALDLLL